MPLLILILVCTGQPSRDRYITIIYNDKGLVSDYKEYEFLNAFSSQFDYKGDFESSRTGDYFAGEGEDKLMTDEELLSDTTNETEEHSHE